MNIRRNLIWIVPAAIAGITVVMFIGGQIVMRLWNWLLPPMFGWHAITFWQAFGLLALCRILFGGFGSHGSGRSGMRGNMRERMAQRMAERTAERVKNMTPEERELFERRLRECGGYGPSTGAGTGPAPSAG